MEKEIIEEIMKECNWWERIIVGLLTKLCLKIYALGGKNCFNNMLF